MMTVRVRKHPETSTRPLQLSILPDIFDMSFASFYDWILSTFSSFYAWILSKFEEIKLDTPSWYLLTSAAVFLVWLLLRGLYRVMAAKWLSISFLILKHAVYPHLLPRTSLTGTATRFRIAATTLYLMVNVLFVTIPKATRADMGTRAATMSVINLIPLLCGPRLSMVTELLGISLRTSLASHRWIGRTAIGLAGLHVAIVAKDGERFVRTWSSISGVAVCSHISAWRQRVLTCDRQFRRSGSYLFCRFVL